MSGAHGPLRAVAGVHDDLQRARRAHHPGHRVELLARRSERGTLAGSIVAGLDWSRGSRLILGRAARRSA